MTVPRATALRGPKPHLEELLIINGRGISRGEDRPLPEEAFEPFTAYAYYQQARKGYVEPSYSPQGIPSSGCSTPQQVEPGGIESWPSISNGWTTGNTTERSSICSLGEDEFDRAASRRVRQLFEQIDSMLFEQRQGPQHLSSESQEWVSRFPHYRILGMQLLPPQDMGFQMIPRAPRSASPDMLSDVTEQDMSHDMHRLSISGQHLEPRIPPIDASRIELSGDDETFSPFEREDIFEQDGFVEDIIAIDYKSPEDEYNERIAKRLYTSNRRKISGMPPITPYACVRDNIKGAVFDFIWSEVISWLRDVLKQYQQVATEAVDEDLENEVKRAVSVHLSEGQHYQPPRGVMPPPSREMSLLSTGRLQERTRLQLGMGLIAPLQEDVKLDGLLTISTKALQSRPKSTLQNEGETPLGLQLRPGSSLTHFNNRPTSVRMNQESRLMSARAKATGRGRLAPLEIAKTPNTLLITQEEDRSQMPPTEVLRGRALTTMTDRLTASPLSFQRNGALPPISLDTRDDSTMKNFQPKKAQFSMRASSAIHDKEMRGPFRDRSGGNGGALDNRPSTTHALYRSETPFGSKRSTTPLGFSSTRLAQGLSAINNLATSPSGNVLHLNVTGSSITPHADAAEAMTSPHLSLQENQEHLDEMIHSQWDPRRGRLIHSGVIRSLEGASQLPRRAKQQQYGNMGSVR